MHKISQTQAKRIWLSDKPIYICPSNIAPSMPFNVAALTFAKEWLEKADLYGKTSKLWKGSREETAWQLMLSNWRYYNASYEAGYYPHFYVDSVEDVPVKKGNFQRMK